ncbi:MAG: hypothetical protein AAF808_10270 [Cyanobacteria bacterium P01_D01_bin.2]
MHGVGMWDVGGRWLTGRLRYLPADRFEVAGALGVLVEGTPKCDRTLPRPLPPRLQPYRDDAILRGRPGLGGF